MIDSVFWLHYNINFGVVGFVMDGTVDFRKGSREWAELLGGLESVYFEVLLLRYELFELRFKSYLCGRVRGKIRTPSFYMFRVRGMMQFVICVTGMLCLRDCLEYGV